VSRQSRDIIRIRPIILEAVKAYKDEVLSGGFPEPDHAFKMPADSLNALKEML